MSFRSHSNTRFTHTKAQLRHGSPEVSDLVPAALCTGPRSPEGAAQLGSTLWYKPCRWRGAVRSRLSTSPAPAKPHLSACQPAFWKRIWEFLLSAFTEYEIQLCIYSLDKLTQLRDNPDTFLSYKIQNPRLEGVIMRPLKGVTRTVLLSQPPPVGPRSEIPIQFVHSAANW